MNAARVALLACLLVVDAATAGVADELLALRSQAVNDPPSAIVAGRKLLDGHALDGRPNDERELAYWLGNAALRQTDDVVLAEIAVRLDSLATAHHDELARAYAGFLRAERLFQRGQPEKGLAESMRAATLIQDRADPRTRAIAALELCDDFTMAANPRTAATYCERSTAGWRALGDRFELARALNLEAHARYALGQLAVAAALFEESRELFARNGDAGFASSVGDNLAKVYLDLGRSEEALQLSQQALAAETSSGRVDNALRSRLNVARALAKLGRLSEAQAEIATAISTARAHGWNVQLEQLLATQASIARASGDLQLALTAQDQIIELRTRDRDQARSTALAELEARFAARERELRIGELEQENRRRELELTTARAAAAEDEVKLQRQRARLAIAASIALALGLSSMLLYQLWRVQRRSTEALRAETLHDALTGVENRRSFFQRMAQVLTKPSAAPRVDALMILDLDHFKQVNDRGGHLFGDQVLVDVTACLQRTLSERAHLARLGGEEFGILAPNLDPTDGLRLAEQLRTAVSQLQFRLGDEDLRITISVGFAIYDADRCHDRASWLRAADQALYSAKAHGRNRVVSAAAA